MTSLHRSALLLSALFLPIGALAAQAPITLSVDLRDAPRKLIHAAEIIPVQPGPMTLAYPKWIPSEHALGPIDQQAGLLITAHTPASTTQTVRWQRDPVELYSYHLTIPAGVHSIEVKMDFITATGGGLNGASTTENLAALDWNTVVLYPYAGIAQRVTNILVTPTIVLPEGWHFASALQPAGTTATAESNGSVTLETVSLERLVDSPLIAGRYFREVPLAPDLTPRHYLDMVADTPASLNIDQAHIDQLSTMIHQARRLFGSWHYNSFRMLMTLSDAVSGTAVDHHESLDNRRPAAFLTDAGLLTRFGDFLPHDFAHSWNGKYRRPAGLATANYQVPVDNRGLWIYEGLTNYLGDVLAVRSGIWTEDQFLGSLAESAAQFSHRPGRTWRDLEDSASMALILFSKSGPAYDNWRRGGYDFYGEGALIWLDVDTTIRNKTEGKKSLNDFLAVFYGGGDTGPRVVPYTFDDLVAALNAVTPNDWAEFLDERLHSVSAEAPMGGITAGGYRLVYKDSPNAWTAMGGEADFGYSIAMEVAPSGTVVDVLAGGVAAKAGFGPGMKILEVNGHTFSIAALQQAIRDARGATAPIELKVTNTGTTMMLHLDYHQGEQYPVLERIPGTPDRLKEMIRPLA